MVNSLHSRFVVGTFFFQGRSAKILGTEILAKHWRHAAFWWQRGGAKIVVSWLHLRFVVGTLFLPRLGCESSGAEILTKHRHYAAFWLKRGGAKTQQKRCWVQDFLRLRGVGREKAKYRKKRAKIKISREFPLVFNYKNHPVGWSTFVNLLLWLFFLLCCCRSTLHVCIWPIFTSGTHNCQLEHVFPTFGSTVRHFTLSVTPCYPAKDYHTPDMVRRLFFAGFLENFWDCDVVALAGSVWLPCKAFLLSQTWQRWACWLI